MSELEEHLQIDREKIRTSVSLQLPLEITSYTLPRNTEAYIRTVMETFLDECHQEHLKEYLNFCLSELLTNAKKANTKRVYFKEKNLDINNREDYEKGMENFKMDTLTNIDHYLELQKKAGLYIKLSLKILADKIYIEIINNSKLTVFEKERIQQKLDSVQQYSNMDEVLTSVLDQSEGAGLGIIIIILMLQKVGLSKENYQLITTDEETITRIILPCNRKVYAGVEMLSYEFTNLKDSVPLLKQSFEPVNKLVSVDTPIDRKELFRLIRTDVTLSLLAIKYAREKDKTCFSLSKALALLSDYDLKFIYSEDNPIVSVRENNPRLEHIWEHSRRVAYYTYTIYKNSLFKDTFPEDEEHMYLLGLFNALGAVFLTAADKEQMDYITELSMQYEEYGEKILKLFTEGNAATYLSMVIAKRFGFNIKDCYDLVGWNGLSIVPEKDKKRVSILHLAEMLQFYDQGMVDFYQTDRSVLKDYGIANEMQFKSFLAKLKTAYEEQLQPTSEEEFQKQPQHSEKLSSLS